MRPRSFVVALALLAAWGGACGGAQRVDRAEREHDAGDEVEQHAVPARSARDLAADATFADLVAIVARQDHLRDSDSDAGCLLRTSESGYRLEADLSVAVRPLPDVATDLDARFEAAPGPVRVLTRYGSYGESGDVGLAAMTTTMPPRRAVATVLVLTDRGVYVRETEQAATSLAPVPLERLAAAIGSPTSVFVTAEAAIPLASLRALLAALPSGLDGQVGLALTLSDETRLPAARAADAEDPAPVCADGLPPLADDAALGDLTPQQILAGITPIRSAGEICVGTSTGPGARGGRVVVDVRIDAGGTVSSACVREDETGDAVLRACLVAALEQLTFDDPGGAVDFELPLVLAPGLSHRQRPLCD